MLNRIWHGLRDENYRSRLALVGTAAAMMVGAGWQLYVHFAPVKGATRSGYSETRPGGATVGNVNIKCAKNASVSAVAVGDRRSSSVHVESFDYDGRNCASR